MNQNVIMNLIIIGAVISLYNIVKNYNPIYSVLNLIIIFVCYASMLIILEQEFLACIFILVNVGAVAVLFLFIIMMINITIVEIKENMKKYAPFMFFMVCNIGMVLLLIIVKYKIITPVTLTESIYEQFFTQLNNNDKGVVGSIGSQGIIYENVYNLFIKTTDVKNIGSNILYGSNSIWFILACLMLLIAMVGVINLTEEFLHSKRFKENKHQEIYKQISQDYLGNIKLAKERKHGYE